MDNYRPISVLPVLSKVFERIVHNQLYTYLEEHNLLSDCQFGFRRRSSTEHAITYFSDFIRTSKDKDKSTGAVFVDFRKAFDTIDHALLLANLGIYGVHGKELTWFEIIYSTGHSLYLFKVHAAKDSQSVVGFRKDPSWATAVYNCDKRYHRTD